MKFFLYGECDQYGTGAWCYSETLREMGHEVAYYTVTQNLERHMARYRGSLPYKAAMRLFKTRMPEFERRRHLDGLQHAVSVFSPDMVVVFKGLLLDREAVKRLKVSGRWVVLINHDDFFSSYSSNRSKLQLDAVAHYDFVFPTKEVNVAELKHVNPKIEFFGFAYCPRIHQPPTPNDADRQEWRSEAVFVGNCYPERTRQLEYLTAHLSIDLKIYGSNWEKLINRSSLTNHIQGKHLGPEEMAKALFYSKVSLGFLCKENRDDYTQRTFEVPACKGVLLAERTARHLSFYKEGTEAEFFDSSNYAEMASKVDHLLKDDDHREALRERGNQAVLTQGHTYEDRLKRLIELYNARH